MVPLQWNYNPLRLFSNANDFQSPHLNLSKFKGRSYSRGIVDAETTIVDKLRMISILDSTKKTLLGAAGEQNTQKNF